MREAERDFLAEVLIVDDREDGLIALSAVLADSNLKVITANSGRKALAHVEQREFAAILLDVQMPELDGFETAALIRENPRHRDVPIIFVTAINKDDSYVHRGYELGAVDYVFKPFDAIVLRSKVAVFVELFLKNKQLEAQAAIVRQAETRERHLRLAELELESLKRYRSLADSIPHSVWRAKPDGKMEYFNRQWELATGLSCEASLGDGWQAAVHPEDLRSLLKAWISAMEAGGDLDLEARLKDAAGEWRWNWIRASVDRRPGGEPIAWLGTCTDVNRRKSLAESLIVARKDADAANEAKTNFLANMSHEIRTPLNSILGFAELMLRSDALDDDLAAHASTIKRNGAQLLKLIDQILDISKVEANRLEIEILEVDLSSMLADIRALFEVQTQERALELRVRCVNAVPTRVSTDPTRLRQILVNLIGNAIKFTPKGRVQIDVDWQAAESARGRLKFRIRDTGVGIDPLASDRLFLPFHQADSSTARQFGGTGLGLALSRRLAQALGGDVTLAWSAPGRGSAFDVEIDASACAGTDTFRDADQKSVLDDDRRLEPSVDALAGLDVLVVDDAADNRTLMSRFLGAVGARVDCAVDGFQGVDKALAGRYDIVLMDIQMPRLDGYGATAKLRGLGYRGPIIALSAHALKEDRERSLEAGCDDHLTKPIDRRTLVAQVARYAGPGAEIQPI